MKKLSCIILIALSTSLFGQINLLNTYTKQIYLTKLHVSGYKYVEVNLTTSLITVYNTNNSVFATMTIQPQPYSIQSVGYISENLFDLDNGLEYYVTTYTSSPTTYNIFKVYNDNGTLLFQRDSASLYQTNSVSTFGLFRADPIFYDGVSTKMRLQVGYGTTTRYELYNLPGTITCGDCSNGTVTAIYSNPKTDISSENIIYPNPASDFIKIKYQLPDKAKKAEIKVFDSTGKLQESFEITSTFDFIYLPKSYSNGLYYFQLLVDNQVLKTEKIIIQK